MKQNHGLPEKIKDSNRRVFVLKVETYETYEVVYGFTKEEVDSWYGANGDIAKIYSYENKRSGDESAIVGIEFTDGRLCIYGCNNDRENISEQEFVEELTNPYWIS